MLDAQKRQATRAKITASGSDPPANAAPAGIDAAMAAPGAMSVMLWNRTSRSPIASRRSPGAAPAAVALVAMAVSAVGDALGDLVPGWSHGRHGWGRPKLCHRMGRRGTAGWAQPGFR